MQAHSGLMPGPTVATTFSVEHLLTMIRADVDAGVTTTQTSTHSPAGVAAIENTGYPKPSAQPISTSFPGALI